MLITLLPLAVPLASALRVAKVIMGVLFIIFVTDALVHYNRGDLYDGHSHFRKLFTGAIVCLVLLAGLSAVSSGVSKYNGPKGSNSAWNGTSGNSSEGGGAGSHSGGHSGGGR